MPPTFLLVAAILVTGIFGAPLLLAIAIVCLAIPSRRAFSLRLLRGGAVVGGIMVVLNAVMIGFLGDQLTLIGLGVAFGFGFVLGGIAWPMRHWWRAAGEANPVGRRAPVA